MSLADPTWGFTRSDYCRQAAEYLSLERIFNLRRYSGSPRPGSAACGTGGYVPSQPASRAGLPYHYITGAVVADTHVRTAHAPPARGVPAGPVSRGAPPGGLEPPARAQSLRDGFLPHPPG